MIRKQEVVPPVTGWLTQMKWEVSVVVVLAILVVQ